jgi:hypothetical protein
VHAGIAQPCLGEARIDAREILGEAVELGEPAVDGDALIVLDRLDAKPGTPLGGEEVAPVRQDQVRVQDAVDAVLQPRARLDDRRAAGDLSAKTLRRVVRLPDLGQKTGGMQLRKHHGVDLVDLDLRVCDRPHLQRRKPRPPRCWTAEAPPRSDPRRR